MKLSKYCFINSKKGNSAFKMFTQLGMALATLAIIFTVAFLVMSQGKEEIRTVEGLNITGYNDQGQQSSASWNATGELQIGVGQFPDWVPIIVIVGVGMGLLTLVAGFAKIRS
jgi:hypothetical protein